MLIRKRITSILLVVVLLFSMILCTGCDRGNANSEKVDTAIFEVLLLANQAVVSAANETEDVASYVENWARDNDKFKVSHDNNGNVIVSLKATEGYEDAATTNLHCSLELAAPDRTALALTSIMYIMENCKSHGFIRALFTEPENGITNMKETYLTADNFISLDWSKNNNIMIGSAGRNDYEVSKELEYQPSSYPNAYRITLTGLNPTMACKTNQLNPVKTLGKLLAELKSSGALLEIAEFNCGSYNHDGLFVAAANESDGYPVGASAIVLVNDNDVNKLTKKVEKSQTKILESYQEDNPDLIYEFTPVSPADYPEVLTTDDTSTLLSFIYTCPCGVYDKNDDGDIISMTNILSCTTIDGLMHMKICSLCQSEEDLQSLNELYQTLCGLYDIDESMKEVSPVMNIKDYESDPLIQTIATISTAVYEGKETTYTFGFDNTAAAQLLTRLPNADIVTYGLTEKNVERQVETLLTFFEQSKPV